jgi:hypothetical protein
LEITEKQVDEALARGQLARVLAEKKELGQAQIVSVLGTDWWAGRTRTSNQTIISR